MKVVSDEGDKAKMMVIQPYSSLCVDGIDSKCKFSYSASTTRAEMHNFVNFTNKIIYVIAMKRTQLPTSELDLSIRITTTITIKNVINFN